MYGTWDEKSTIKREIVYITSMKRHMLLKETNIKIKD